LNSKNASSASPAVAASSSGKSSERLPSPAHASPRSTPVPSPEADASLVNQSMWLREARDWASAAGMLLTPKVYGTACRSLGSDLPGQTPFLLADGTRASGRSASPPGADPDTHQRTLQCSLGPDYVDVPVALLAGTPKQVLGTRACCFRARHVDLFGGLSAVRENGHPVMVDLHKATRDREAVLLTADAEDQFTRVERRHERCMPRQNGQLAFAARNDQRVHTRFDTHDAFRGHDFNRQRHGPRPQPADGPFRPPGRCSRPCRTPAP